MLSDHLAEWDGRQMGGLQFKGEEICTAMADSC